MYSVCKNVMCGYSCVFVCTVCAIMLCVFIAVCFEYSVCNNVVSGYSCVFVCTACAVMLCVAIVVYLCVQRVQ